MNYLSNIYRRVGSRRCDAMVCTNATVIQPYAATTYIITGANQREITDLRTHAGVKRTSHVSNIYTRTHVTHTCARNNQISRWFAPVKTKSLNIINLRLQNASKPTRWIEFSFRVGSSFAPKMRVCK